MYRIELAPGEETVFRTIEELAIGVRNGLVTPRARIYHTASEKWLPIEFHPHYKRALELPPIRFDAPAVRTPERGETPLSFAAPRPIPPEAPTAAPGFAGSSFTAPAFIQPEVESPAAVEEAAHREPPAPSPTGLPPVTVSPVLQLPAISYPEITPAEEPVAEPATSATRSRRPLQLAGAVAVLALGAYAMMSARSPSPDDAAPAPTVADRPELPPVVDSALTRPPAPEPAKTAAARPPAPVVMTQPASSGFAPALEPRAIVSSPPPAPRAGLVRGPGPAAPDSSIAPAPIAVDLALPALPGGESLAPLATQRGDSAMKRILRAVSGGKDAPRRP